MQPTKQLKEEHNGIKVMLQALETISDRLKSGKEVDTGHLDMIAEFMQIYIDKCHHGKEERMLFPAVEKTGVTKENKIIEELLAEHVSGRVKMNKFIKDIVKYKKSKPKASPKMTQNIKSYVTSLNKHIEKEDTIFYPLADQNLPATVQGELMWKMEEFEEEVIGAGEHEKLNNLLNTLIDTYINS